MSPPLPLFTKFCRNLLTYRNFVRVTKTDDRTIYVNVDSPDQGFPYFNFLETSGGTLLWDNRRLIGRSLIVLARKVQNNQ